MARPAGNLLSSPTPQKDGFAINTAVHRFHIPVMGTGFTIDTPLKVARYGISSVISLVDDVLIEQMRQKLSRDCGPPRLRRSAPRHEDSRAHRITSYLDMMDELVEGQVEQAARVRLRRRQRDHALLRDAPRLAAARALREDAGDGRRRREARAAAELRAAHRARPIDVNIMTKLDRDRFARGKELGPKFSDAMSALRGYANSKVESSLVLSAGLNRRLFSYLAEFGDFFPTTTGRSQADHPEGERFPLRPWSRASCWPRRACGSPSTASNRA